MPAKNASYRKTLIISSVAGALVVAAAYAGLSMVSGQLPASVILALFAVAVFVGVLLLLLALSSLLVEYRDSRRQRGDTDLFLAANDARSEDALRGQSALSPVRLPKLRRWLCATDFIVGDRVRIRSANEIASTLDARGCMDGLPFMPEMAGFCGTVGTVFRCVDKVYDYGGKKDLRRIKDVVLVTGLRCDGGAHDGCQAGCYLLWKTAWLAPAVDAAAAASAQMAQHGTAPVEQKNISAACAPMEDARAPERRYVCQYTEIVNASAGMNARDLRQDLRPLVAGNLTLGAFAVALLTRLFNAVQRLRGGTGYPLMQLSSRTSSQSVNLALQPGEWVRVTSPDRIFDTLNSTGKNLGLWFDRDMLKHCGLRYRVLRRVDKIIDDATRRMIRMKTPCVVLDTTDSSGEFLRFCAQSDPAFWREAWLERVENAVPRTASELVGAKEHSAGHRSS